MLMITELKTYKVECDSCHTELVLQIEDGLQIYPYSWSELSLDNWQAEALNLAYSTMYYKEYLLCDVCLRKIKKT
jgi:hypothetical protein